MDSNQGIDWYTELGWETPSGGDRALSLVEQVEGSPQRQHQWPTPSFRDNPPDIAAGGQNQARPSAMPTSLSSSHGFAFVPSSVAVGTNSALAQVPQISPPLRGAVARPSASQNSLNVGRAGPLRSRTYQRQSRAALYRRHPYSQPAPTVQLSPPRRDIVEPQPLQDIDMFAQIQVQHPQPQPLETEGQCSLQQLLEPASRSSHSSPMEEPAGKSAQRIPLYDSYSASSASSCGNEGSVSRRKMDLDENRTGPDPESFKVLLSHWHLRAKAGHRPSQWFAEQLKMTPDEFLATFQDKDSMDGQVADELWNVMERPAIRSQTISRDSSSRQLQNMTGRHIMKAYNKGQAAVGRIPINPLGGEPLARISHRGMNSDTLRRSIEIEAIPGLKLYLDSSILQAEDETEEEYDNDEVQSRILEKLTRGPKVCRPPPGLIRIYNEDNLDIPKNALESSKHPVRSWATPRNVDLRLLRAIPITSMEAFTFFPDHATWREYANRFFSNQWDASEIVAAMNRARGIVDMKLGVQDDNLRKQISGANATLGNQSTRGNPIPKGMRIPITDYTCANWTPPPLKGWNKHLIDYYVKDLAAGVLRRNFPKDADAGQLTRAIEYILDNPELHHIKISNLPLFVLIHGLDEGGPPMGATDKNPDIDAIIRHHDSLKAYRKTMWK